jgi:MerR family transcriptional regulator/heat shock protein HspR
MNPLNRLPQAIDQDAPVFLISTAARLAGMHPQTLRTWDRLGLVVPHRSKGRGRRYSARDVARLRLIQCLSQDEGINLNGIRRILELQADNEQLRRDLSRLVLEITRLHASPAAPGVFAASARGDVWTRVQAVGPRELMP